MDANELKTSGRFLNSENQVVKVGRVSFGGNKIVLIAGPCAVESKTQFDSDVSTMNKVDMFRGGAYKPRTSPYSFQGLEKNGIEILKEESKKLGKPFVTEITKIEDIPYFIHNVNMIQVGARDMQNFELLKALGRTNKPILLKRGFGNTVEELLLASEYITKEGNKNVVLCERGIRTFEDSTRFTLDLSAIALIKKYSILPVVVDPSHAAGKSEYVSSLALAAVAAGADGLLIEVHSDPDHALSDKGQALTPSEYNDLVAKISKVAKAINRKI